MEKQSISSAGCEGKLTAPLREYVFSPKAVVIAGPPAGGKSFVAKQLKADFGYKIIALDGINDRIAAKYGGDIEEVRDPRTFNDYKGAFVESLRAIRYQNIVLEGCRVSIPHVYQAFKSALCDVYSPFTILQSFYLFPPRDEREERFLLRQKKLMDKLDKEGDAGVSKAAVEQPFCEVFEPILPDFVAVEDGDCIMEWADGVDNWAHPGVAKEDREVFKAIAESESYNPFYQTIEYSGRVLVPGFTESQRAWRNILELGVDFSGKSLCDYGCMHGYYTFKAEEAGASGVGLDVDKGAVDLSNYLAGIKGSNCHFMVYDITTPLARKYDIILALNVLHRTGKFELTVENMFRHCSECVLEVGQSQLPVIIGEGTRQGFKLLRNIPSHRTQSCIGPRRLLHMTRA